MNTFSKEVSGIPGYGYEISHFLGKILNLGKFQTLVCKWISFPVIVQGEQAFMNYYWYYILGVVYSILMSDFV